MHHARAIRRCSTAALGAGATLVLLGAAPAGAHPGHPAAGVADGLTHPLQGLDHLVAMVAVGVLAAVTADRVRSWSVPATFLGAMVLGGTIGLLGGPVPGGELAVALSVVALGALLVVGDAARLPVVLALTALAGAAHGNAHGVEAPSAADPTWYVLGFLATTAALHALGATAGFALRRTMTARLALGAAVSGAGVLLLLGG